MSLLKTEAMRINKPILGKQLLLKTDIHQHVVAKTLKVSKLSEIFLSYGASLVLHPDACPGPLMVS